MQARLAATPRRPPAPIAAPQVVRRPLMRGEQRWVDQVRKRARRRRRVQLPHKDTDLAAELGLAISDEIHITLGRADIRQAIGRMENPTLTRLVPRRSNLEERVRSSRNDPDEIGVGCGQNLGRGHVKDRDGRKYQKEFTHSPDCGLEGLTSKKARILQVMS
jgi:hypothetical protein